MSMGNGNPNRFTVWAVVVLAVFNVGLMAFIWYDHWDRPPFPGPRGHRPAPDDFIVRELGASGDQAALIRELRDTQMRETDSLKAMIRELSLKMVEELFAPTPDSARISSWSDTIGALHARLELRLFDHFRDVRELCAADQQEKLKQLLIDVLRRQPPFPGGGPGGQARPGPPEDRMEPPMGERMPGAPDEPRDR